MRKLLVATSMLAVGILLAAGIIRASSPNPTPAQLAQAESIMKRVAASGAKNTYSAVGKTTIIYRGRPVTSEIKMYHEKPDKCRIEYYKSPLHGLIVGNIGKQAWRFDPKLRKVVKIESSGCIKNNCDMGLLVKNYRVEPAGNANIAGRPAHSLIIKSKSGQIRKNLWADSKTFVVLRSEDYDTHGARQSSTEFKSIKYVNDLPDTLFHCPKNTSQVTRQEYGKTMSLADLSKRVGFQVRTPKYLPGGYKLDGYRLYRCPHKCGGMSAYIRYTNGMNSISVFELIDSDCRCCGSHNSDAGMCIEQGGSAEHSATFTSGGKRFVIIADTTRAELEKIARSLR